MDFVIPQKNKCTHIAIDFDGTIYNRLTQKPFADAVESIKWFKKWGYEITIYSSRANSLDSRSWMSKWLHEHRILFDHITNVKPTELTWIIDDRGIHFQDNWLAITEAIKKETFPWKSPSQNQV